MQLQVRTRGGGRRREILTSLDLRGPPWRYLCCVKVSSRMMNVVMRLEIVMQEWYRVGERVERVSGERVNKEN